MTNSKTHFKRRGVKAHMHRQRDDRRGPMVINPALSWIDMSETRHCSADLIVPIKCMSQPMISAALPPPTRRLPAG